MANPANAMAAALQAVNGQLITANVGNDPGAGFQGARSIIIIRKTVEQNINSSFPVTGVLEVTVRLTPIADKAQALSADEKKAVHLALGEEIQAAINTGIALQVGAAAPQHRTIYFARTLPEKKHYITADPSTDFIKAAYLKKIFHALNLSWAQRGGQGNLPNPRLRGAVAEFLLSRPLDYQRVQ